MIFTRLFTSLCMLLVVSTNSERLTKADKAAAKAAKTEQRKMERGLRIFGDQASHFERSDCGCAAISNCWLVGDPHVKSFYGKHSQVSGKNGLDIYTHENFSITCTTYGRDVMDYIKFGHVHEWHVEDCNGQPGFLPSKSHTYSDGSVITAQVYCEKRKRQKIHINLLVKKTTILKHEATFEEHESTLASSGVCVGK